MNSNQKIALNILVLILFFIPFTGGLIGIIKVFYLDKETKAEAIQSVCAKYGHTFGEWKLNEDFLLRLPPDLDPKDGDFIWRRECKLCAHIEWKRSFSGKTPDATKAMVLVAKDEAEKKCNDLKAQILADNAYK